MKLTSLLTFIDTIHLTLASAIPDLHPHLDERSLDISNDLLVERSPAGSAGLRWGPYNVGPLKLYITNPHTGYAGPKYGVAPHINVHVDRKAERNTYREVINLHVVKYTQKGGKQCLYMWDSKSSKVVFDKCFDDFKTAAREGVEAAKEVLEKVMEGVGFVARIAATVALGVALVAAILLSGLTGVAA